MNVLSQADGSVGSKCISCGADVSLKAKFCEECGALQATTLASSREPVEEMLLDSKVSGITPQTSENPMRSSAASIQTSNPSEAGSVDERASTQKKPFVIYGIVAAVLVLACVGVWYLHASQQQQGAAEQEQPSTAMGTPIGFDSLWEKAYSSGQGIRAGIEIGKRYQITVAANDDLTELTSATSAYDHNAIYGDRDFDDLTQYESFLQAHRESEEANRVLVCNVVVSMGSNNKFRFHRVDGCHSAPKLRY